MNKLEGTHDIAGETNISTETLGHISLEQLERLGTWLDSSISVPGTRFKIGWDTLIGLIPGVGDAATAALSSCIVWQAKKMGVSRWTMARMIANVGIDTVLGAIPLFGDLFDAAYKSNQKNIALLQRHLEKESSAMADKQSPLKAIDTKVQSAETS